MAVPPGTATCFIKIPIMTRIFIRLLMLMSVVGKLCAQDVYTEMYRPQYHASPRNGFMGDPNGPMKFGGKYHLFWWGHLRSEDMVHWEEINSNALHGTPSGFGNWSGSVVMDIENTAGFNSAEDTAMIAVYTLHEDATGYQHQAISTSLNHGSFEYYDSNPVIESNEPDFRDPQVFWHEQTDKWIMVITKPVDRGIRIYTSDDLKSWDYESTFEGYGARKEIWEVPDLFELPLNGDPQNMKWVMTCGMGPNRMQFWVGDFDGTTFSIDPEENFFTGSHVGGEVFEDFEAGYGDWTVEGESFGGAPAAGTFTDQQEVMGYTGSSLVNSFLNGDGSTGKLISPEFEISRPFINFQIGGGASANELGFRLVVDGEVVQSIASSSNTEIMQWRGVSVSEFIGKTGHIEIVDEATGGWGHVLIDHIVFSDELYDTRTENANWADWGYDFYAGKTFRNYDFDDDRKVWLAWMGNWTYARDVPTRPWKGNQSIPRALSLVKNEFGFQLIQQPIEELKGLRSNEYSITNQQVDGVVPVTVFQPEWNVYELKLSFKVSNRDQVFGVTLAQSDDDKGVKITYDAASSTLELDRSGTPFSFAYKRKSVAPIHFPKDSVLDLHIFIDQASVEVFANDYQTSISSLAFTNVLSTALSLFSETGPTELLSLEAWDIASIWGVTPDQVQRPEVQEDPLKVDSGHSMVYPNPVSAGQYITFGKNNIQNTSICDLGGRVVFTQSTGTNQVLIPDTLSPGLYLVKYISDGRHYSDRIIIRR